MFYKDSLSRRPIFDINFNIKVMKKIVKPYGQEKHPRIETSFSKLITAFLIAILLVNGVYALLPASQTNSEVLKAFELRINGKVDEAVTLLKDLLKKNPQNATAHFELARTLHYMNMRGSKEADEHLKTALELDPENVIYAYYNAKNCFIKAYIALQTSGENAKDLIGNVCHEFVNVLEMKSDYPEAAMYLVEIYGILPEELGGDKTKAEEFVQKLEDSHSFYGAKARLIMMPEETNRIAYWKNYIEKNTESCAALQELGVSYLFANNAEEAENCFKKAIALDKSQNIRMLDLARYHMLKVMQNKEVANTELPKSKKYIEEFLVTEPTPIPALQAFSLGMLAKIEMFAGNNESAQGLMEKAKKMDPYFSRASAIPSASLFESPDKIDHHYKSFFSWY